MSFEVTSFYLRVELDWDHRDSDGDPAIQVQDDGLHTLPSPLLDKVRQLINESLQGSPEPSP